MSHRLLFTINSAIDTPTVAYFYFYNILTMSILNFGLRTGLDMDILFPSLTDFNGTASPPWLSVQILTQIIEIPQVY